MLPVSSSNAIAVIKHSDLEQLQGRKGWFKLGRLKSITAKKPEQEPKQELKAETIEDV